jgi:hypothetical protein
MVDVMNLVLYSAVDMSPITILPVPMWAIDMLEARQYVSFPVFGQPHLSPPGDPVPEKCITVTVWAEPIWRKNLKTLMLFTNMDVEALMLEPGYLPGQVRDVQLRERGAFLRGFIAALEAMR